MTKPGGDGFMRCESITGDGQGFPIKNLNKIYPLVCGVRGEEFYGYDGTKVIDVVFNTFVFPGKGRSNTETEVVVTVAGMNRQLQFTYSHFVQQFTPKDFERCQI